MKISLLTVQTPLCRGIGNDFYPFIKWKSKFNERGIRFAFFNNLESFLNVDCEISILDYRFLKRFGDRKKSDRSKIIEAVHNLKDHNKKVILFDTGDGTGSRCFWLTPYVDIHLKKQLLKERVRYTSHKMKDNYMVWIPDEIIKDVFKDDYTYKVCPKDELYKLKLGWNLGFTDYRYFPLSRYYPIGTSVLFNRLYKYPKFTSPKVKKELLVSYRGGYHYQPHYKYQRKKVIDTLNKISANREDVATGGRVSKRKFISELKSSKIIVSPYGWGEICYRDFEAFIYGGLLVKPDMDHVETYPNIYRKGETYISVKWDMSDLEEKIEQISDNYEKYLPIADQTQNEFRRVIQDFKAFYEHFSNSILADL